MTHRYIKLALTPIEEGLRRRLATFENETLEREALQAKHNEITSLMNSPKNRYSKSESAIIYKGLLRLRDDFWRSCELFEKGTIEREALDKKLEEIDYMISSFRL